MVNELGAIVINCPNCLSGTKVNKTFDACGLNYSVLKQLQQILILVHFHHFYLDQHPFFSLPNNLIVSGDNNSSL